MTREEATEYIYDMICDIHDNSNYSITDKENVALNMAIESLKQTTWIPINERLPKSAGVYIVSRWFSDGEESAILTDANYYDGNGDWYNDNRINWSRDLVTDKIVAWMMLPEPYKKEGDGE